MSELSIKVTIAGRIYPITVKAEEEDTVRASAKAVDENIKYLQENYAVKDKQDLLAMSALQFSTKVLEQDSKDRESLAPKGLDDIEKLVDSMLN
jgi:cell division protein ZapA